MVLDVVIQHPNKDEAQNPNRDLINVTKDNKVHPAREDISREKWPFPFQSRCHYLLCMVNQSGGDKLHFSCQCSLCMCLVFSRDVLPINGVYNVLK